MKTSKLTTILAFFFVILTATEVVIDRHKSSPDTPSIVQNIEDKLNSENWKVNENFWKVLNVGGFYREYDKPLILESWMTDEKAWNIAALLPVETEKPLTLEAWMTDRSFWEPNEEKYASVLEME
jgi:hypothetical protein